MSRYIAERDKPIGSGHTLLIEVPIDATDVFNPRQVMILSYILENTPKEVVDDLAKKYRVTSTRIVMEMRKIYKKLNVDAVKAKDILDRPTYFENAYSWVPEDFDFEENSKNYTSYNEEVRNNETQRT